MLESLPPCGYLHTYYLRLTEKVARPEGACLILGIFVQVVV